MRTRTGRGLRQSDLMAPAFEALTSMYGLIPRILITAVMNWAVMGTCYQGYIWLSAD